MCAGSCRAGKPRQCRHRAIQVAVACTPICQSPCPWIVAIRSPLFGALAGVDAGDHLGMANG